MATRFDLTSAKATWLASLQSREALSADQLRELDGHLEDSVELLTSHGLSPEEAFLIGTRRLGGVEELAIEFRKAADHGFSGLRAKWMLRGMALYVVGLGGVQILSRLAFGAASAFAKSWARDAALIGCCLLVSLLGLATIWQFLRGRILWRPKSPHRTTCWILAAAVFCPALVQIGTTWLVASHQGAEAFASLANSWISSQIVHTLLWFGVLAFWLNRSSRPAEVKTSPPNALN